jgi:hypothetical protein
MKKPFKSFEEIVESQDVESIIKEMEKSKLNEPYEKLLKFVGSYSGRDDLDLSDFYGLAHCVYGWMPRMLTLEEKLDLQTLNKEWKIAEKGIPECPDKEFYPELLRLCGNSIVGLSKLLHFAYPEEYAIIDSNVYKALKGKDTTMPYGIEKRIPLYRNYMKWISEIVENNEVFGKIRKKTKALDKPTDQRRVELFLYTLGKGIKRIQKSA